MALKKERQVDGVGGYCNTRLVEELLVREKGQGGVQVQAPEAVSGVLRQT